MKLLLNGYFYRNLGDDLFFHIIANRYPNHQFYAMIHGDHADAYKGVSNVKVLPQTKLLRGLDKVLFKLSPSMSLYAQKGKKMDASILIGGSMFIEMYDDGYDLKRLRAMPQNRKGLYIMGINFGPHKTQGYLDACREYLATATDVCFRDATSYGLFSDLPNTRCGSDIVFGIEAICPRAEEKRNVCVISVMDFGANPALAPYEADYLAFVTDMIRHQHAQGREVELVSFCAWEGDERAMEKILARCDDPDKVRLLKYDGQNWRQVCRHISSAACMVASRFHSVVLGLAWGVPTLAISYSNKTVQLLKDMGCGNKAVLPQMLAQLKPETAEYISGLDMTSWRQKAETHFEKLDALLK